MMQAVLHKGHDKSILGNGPSKSVAKEFVAKTPAKKRKKFAEILRNK